MLAGLQQPDQAYIQINDHILTDTTSNVDVKIQNAISVIYFKIINYFQI